jgi:hypothetical protein
MREIVLSDFIFKIMKLQIHKISETVPCFRNFIVFYFINADNEENPKEQLYTL